jgi:hypothetical protein
MKKPPRKPSSKSRRNNKSGDPAVFRVVSRHFFSKKDLNKVRKVFSVLNLWEAYCELCKWLNYLIDNPGKFGHEVYKNIHQHSYRTLIRINEKVILIKPVSRKKKTQEFCFEFSRCLIAELITLGLPEKKVKESVSSGSKSACEAKGYDWPEVRTGLGLENHSPARDHIESALTNIVSVASSGSYRWMNDDENECRKMGEALAHDDFSIIYDCGEWMGIFHWNFRNGNKVRVNTDKKRELVILIDRLHKSGKMKPNFGKGHMKLFSELFTDEFGKKLYNKARAVTSRSKDEGKLESIILRRIWSKMGWGTI